MNWANTNELDNLFRRHWSVWCLRLVILLQCLGVSGRYFFSGWESESDVYGLLYFDLGWPEVVAQRIDDWGVLACLAAGWVIMFGALLQQFCDGQRRNDSSKIRRSEKLTDQWTLNVFGRRIEMVAAIVVSAWMLTLAVTHMVRGELYSELALGEQAVRYLAPLMIVFVSVQRPISRWVLITLALAVAATFAVHGYMALNCYGCFADLILLTDARLTHLEINQTQVEWALVVIGAIDIVLAALLVATWWRWIAIYMTAWGLITAVSRITAFGLIAWPEMLIRSANWGVPLTIALILLAQRNQAASEISRSTLADAGQNFR